MPRKIIFKNKILVIGVISAFLLLPLPAQAAQKAQVPMGSVSGYVYEGDLDSPVENAVVKIRNVRTEKEFESTPTTKNGYYQIRGIEEGRYTLGVTTKEGDFNFEFILFIKADEEAKLNLALKPGVASVLAQKEHKAFFLTPLGIAVILASAGGAGIIYGSTQKEDHISAYKK